MLKAITEVSMVHDKTLMGMAELTDKSRQPGRGLFCVFLRNQLFDDLLTLVGL